MANTPDYNWPPMEKRRIIGKPYKRVDGPQKASGRAKYSSDLRPKDLLFGVYLTCPHAHARVTSIDTSGAEKTAGVKAVHVVSPAGTEIQWAGTEIAAVAATTEEIARDAVRKIKVDYEVLPHMVKEDDLGKAGARAKAAGESVKGDPDKAFQEAEAVSEGQYGIPVVTHCCLETHGMVIQWQGDQVSLFPSTQDVTHYAGSLAPNIKVPIANIHVKQDHIGGGFGSKFGPESWDQVGADLSKKAGGRPVKLFLDRATEQAIAGNRPSAFAKIRIAGKKDGTVTGWQSESWATGGFTGGGSPPLPYIIDTIPNQRLHHTSVSVNAGSSRAWRAPNNQQASYLTCSALEDFAAKIGMDPMEVFDKNVAYAPKARVETYRYQLQKAAEIADWKKLWHPRGQGGTGVVKRGLGLGFGTWGGGGHQSQCRTTIHPDGSVLVEIGTQDLGTGTRTIIVQVAAETLGLPLGAIKLAIGTNDLPPDSASGGSTTVGGVSSSTRKSSMNALAKLFEAAAPALGAQPEQLEAVDGHIRVKDNPSKSLTWQAACRKLGVTKISEMGENQQRNPMGLNTSGVAGIQIADVSVDTETGLVKINRYVAVQDCGMVINPRLAESVCYGAIIMGIGTALFEERVMDEQTGRMLNPDMEFYKLAGINDIGEIVVHLDIRPENDKRGVVGLGEPPAIAICAAVGNAVANAIGVRVPNIPMTPDRVLAALEGRNA
ncbi:MAG: xanthine dehydrogenase family protein molybdopterin-binding subunit [Bryobacteraceae bacterium]|jgi:xanthine dehydrogenase YagR molybdenum-binding subunit